MRMILKFQPIKSFIMKLSNHNISYTMNRQYKITKNKTN